MMLSSRQHGIRRKPVSPISPTSPPISPDPRIPSIHGQIQEIPLNDGGSQEVPSHDGQSQVSARRGGIHWRASTAMVASLLFGMLLALGHHLFYAHLDGKPVGAPTHVLTGVTRQQLNLTLGTLFAFLVRAFLAVAVTIAYTQLVWRAVKRRATTLTTIDTMFHVVSNFWSLGHFAVWWRYPLLLLLALTIW